MSRHALAFETDLKDLDAAAWAARLEEQTDDLGYFQPLGDQHLVTFLDAGPKLFVTFENAHDVRKLPDAEPRGYRFVRTEGWSHLALIGEGESWFRDPAVYGYFDRLVDDGFFEDFDQVLFYGAHAGAYAACAFSVAAPGARVLAIRPQATLDPRVAGFDNRYARMRRQDFTSRYGYAPDMIDAAHEAFVVFDPLQRMDSVHAALFRRPNVTHLRATGLGRRIDSVLDNMDILSDLIVDAMDGDLNEAMFLAAFRGRKAFAPYVRGLINRAINAGHKQLAANACAYMLRRRDDPFLSARLNELARDGFAPVTRVETSAAE